ncbi:Pentatricopeptide repeat-containing protein [Forsythia ovata]|uniref:Pentatricopeptide repeat-containing protein n=1 Tax=Forsythia ovata TaxID=205694 RepID=A0ABD1P4F3_9LAMI
MPVVSVSRYLFLPIPHKPLGFSFTKLVLFTTSSPSAEKFLINLLENRSNTEKVLESVKAKLDAPCISEVLKRCVVNEPQLGLRFFIWSGLHPTYRHSSYMYSKACKLLGLEKNPSILVDVISAYRDENSVVSVKMFKVVLNLCRAAKDEKLGLWVLRKMKEFNCRPDTVAYNVVIRLVVEKGELDEAMGLMREMGLIDLYPDMITYVSMIKGFCDVGRLEDACQLIKCMKGHGCLPNAVVYSTLLDGVCKHGSLEKALEFLGKMEKEDEDCRPNVVTYSTLIKGFVEKGRAMEALGVLDRMEDTGVQPNRVTITALIDGLCKEGLVEEARNIIDRVSGGSEQHNKFYGLLVVSLCRIGKTKEAEKIFRMMIASGMKPNDFVSCTIIKAIFLEHRVLDGYGLFDSLEKSGHFPAIDSDICSIMLAGLCEKSHLVEAAKLATLMVERRIQLKSPYVQNIVEYLKNYGEDDLASHIGSIDSKL